MYEVARKTITSSNYANEKKTNFIFHKSVIKNKNGDNNLHFFLCLFPTCKIGYDAYTTNVVLLSAEDNQRQLVNVSRQLCDKTNHSEVNVDSVDSLLKSMCCPKIRYLSLQCFFCRGFSISRTEYHFQCWQSQLFSWFSSLAYKAFGDTVRSL